MSASVETRDGAVVMSTSVETRDGVVVMSASVETRDGVVVMSTSVETRDGMVLRTSETLALKSNRSIGESTTAMARSASVLLVVGCRRVVATYCLSWSSQNRLLDVSYRCGGSGKLYTRGSPQWRPSAEMIVPPPADVERPRAPKPLNLLDAFVSCLSRYTPMPLPRTTRLLLVPTTPPRSMIPSEGFCHVMPSLLLA